MTPILILAAGQSSRMRGCDKLAETVDGVPLLTRIAEAAVATGEPVFVALPGHDHPRAVLLDGLDVTRLVLRGSAEGMGGTLRDGVAALPEAERFLVLLADHPLIGRDEIAAVLAAPAAARDALIWRGAAEDGTPGHPILFDGKLKADFAALGGDDGAKSVVAAQKERTHLVPLPGRAATLDLDTPEAWAAFRAGRGN